MLNKFLSSSASVYIVILLMIVCIILIISSFLRFILRKIFKKIRFFVCFVIVSIVLASGLGIFAYSPVSRFADDPNSKKAQELASKQFKGFFSPDLPLLAWRFQEIKTKTPTLEDSVFDDDSSSSESNSKSADKLVHFRIQYLPVGEVTVAYDPITNKFQLEKGLDKSSGSGIIETLFQGAGRNILDSLPKAKSE